MSHSQNTMQVQTINRPPDMHYKWLACSRWRWTEANAHWQNFYQCQVTWFSRHEGRSVCLQLLLPDCNQTQLPLQKNFKKRKFPQKVCINSVTQQETMPREGVATAITLFNNEGEGSAHNKYLCKVRGALSRCHIRNLLQNAFLHQPWNIHALFKVFMWTSVQVSPWRQSTEKLKGSNTLSKQHVQLC